MEGIGPKPTMSLMPNDYANPGPGMYNTAPYAESAAKSQIWMRIARALAGAGQGIAAARPGYGAGNAFLGFGQSFGASQAAKQAAEQYAQKQQDAQMERDLNEYKKRDIISQIDARAKEKPEKPTAWAPQTMQEALDFEKAKAGIKTDQTAASQGAGLDDRTLNGLARAIHEQGLDALGKLGFGNKSAAMRQQALTRWSALYPDDDLATIGAGFKADQSSAVKLQTQSDAVSAFKNTVAANRNILNELKGTIPESGIRFVNAPWRTLASQFGSRSMAKYDAALKSIQTEYSRIVNNPNLTGTLTDTAQREVQALAKGDLTWGQLTDALDVLERESSNRKMYFQQQINSIKGRIGGAQTPPASQGDVEWVMDANGNLTRKGQ